jgi:hypothetical protein
MSEDAHSSEYWQDALARVNAHVIQPPRYSEWVEEQVTAELRDKFFLHEMRIAECDFHRDRIIVYTALLSETIGG